MHRMGPLQKEKKRGYGSQGIRKITLAREPKEKTLSADDGGTQI
jgi:hypothetical protein